MQGKRLFYFGNFSRYSPVWAGRRLYTPPVEAPAPAHPDGLHITGSSAGRAKCKAGHAKHDTRPDAGHATPVCTRYQTGRAGTIGQGAGAGLPAHCVRNCAETDVPKPKK